MRVKKVDPEWYPSENKSLAVGDIIELSDPRNLIIEGKVVPVDDNNVEMPAAKALGEVTDADMKEFQEYLEYKYMMSYKKKNEELEEKTKVLEGQKQEIVEEATAQTPADEAKQKRLDALAKAREAKKQKAQEAN